jgi:preprotein translocase subunit SecY
MKNFYTLFLFVLCLAKTSLVAQNVNISTKINGFRHNWDCCNDGASVLCIGSNFPDPRYKVWIGYNGTTFSQSTNGPGLYCGASDYTYIPLRIAQAGVMPIIFAGSILQMPQIISFFLEKSTSVTFTGIAAALKNFTSTNIWYMVTYFILIFFFTYFYTAVTFDAESMSNNLQKNGAFVPGIRPGAATAEYVATLLSRTTFFGAIFFAIIAVMPFLLQRLTGNSLFAIGGTGILIGVSVCTDLIKKLGAQASMREY